jgi:hypothetical protein
LWGSDTAVTLPVDGTRPDAPRYFPPAGGFRLAVFTLGPSGATPPQDLDMEAAIAEFDERVPGLAEVQEPDEPGMHTTDTVDFGYVLSRNGPSCRSPNCSTDRGERRSGSPGRG